MSKILFGCAISIYTIYLLLFLWNLYNSALVVAIFYLFIFLTPSIVSPIAGTQVDRGPKKRIGYIVIFLSLVPIMMLFVYVNIYSMIIVFISLLICEAYLNINYNVVTRMIVTNKKLIYANNMFTVSIGITNFVGYLVGAYFYSSSFLYYSLWIMLILFMVSIIMWSVSTIPEKIKEKKSEKNKKYTEIFKYLSQNKHAVYLLFIYDVIILFTIAIVIPAYIPYCFDFLKMSVLTYGFYSGLTSFLLVIVPLGLHKFIKPNNVRKYAITSILYEGIITIFIALNPLLITFKIYKILVFIVLTAIISIPSTLEITSFSTMFQKMVPLHLLGRFYSVRSILRGTINAIGLLLAGFFIDLIGPLPVILFSGVILIVMFLPTKIVLSKFPVHRSRE